MIITKAAIMYANGEILEGHNYVNIFSLARKLGMNGEYIEGFMTSSDEFVLPGKAAAIAVESGQLPSVLGKLTPEQLWPRVELE